MAMNIFKENPYVDGKKIDIKETEWEENNNRNTIILKNLGFENTIEEIRKVFSEYEVSIITMLRDEDGFGKGEALVQFKDACDFEEVVQRQQIRINKRNISIGDYAKVEKMKSVGKRNMIDH